jgi:hypothetical protein
VGLKLNGTYKLLYYADDENLLGDSTLKKNANYLADASRKVALETNVEIFKYILLVPQQNAGQIRK